MIYRLFHSGLTGEFIEIEKNAFQDIQLACISSEFQKISLTATEVFTSDESGGMVFPDFYYDDAVPLFSESCMEIMRKAGVENLFTKEVTVTDRIQGISRKYILGLPPRIAVHDSHGKPDESRAGNYMIFKADISSGNDIYITGKLKQELQKNMPSGMEIMNVL